MSVTKLSGKQSPDCAATTNLNIETDEGAEQVNINLATGEITYGPDACKVDSASKEDE